jgi:hypothetical protein
METLEELLRAWRDAEARGDVAALDELLSADFRGDGPVGFVIDRDGWLHQFRGGDLALEAFDWTATEVNSTASTAVAVGIQTRTAQYLGQDCSGEFVCTLVAVRRGGYWTITNLQLGERSPRSLPPAVAPLTRFSNSGQAANRPRGRCFVPSIRRAFHVSTQHAAFEGSTKRWLTTTLKDPTPPLGRSWFHRPIHATSRRDRATPSTGRRST